MREIKQYLYTIKPVRLEMLTVGPTPEEEKTVSQHIAHLQRLAQEGVVVLAGRTQTADPGTFGIVILNANSEDEARQRMEGDPAVKGGVMRAELYPFRVAVKM
jgi:uncharacterized protein YciI